MKSKITTLCVLILISVNFMTAVSQNSKKLPKPQIGISVGGTYSYLSQPINKNSLLKNFKGGTIAPQIGLITTFDLSKYLQFSSGFYYTNRVSLPQNTPYYYGKSENLAEITSYYCESGRAALKTLEIPVQMGVKIINKKPYQFGFEFGVIASKIIDTDIYFVRRLTYNELTWRKTPDDVISTQKEEGFVSNIGGVTLGLSIKIGNLGGRIQYNSFQLKPSGGVHAISSGYIFTNKSTIFALQYYLNSSNKK